MRNSQGRVCIQCASILYAIGKDTQRAELCLSW